MNPRSNPILSAILIVILVASWGRAQDNLHPVPEFPAAPDTLRERQEPLATSESALERSQRHTLWISDDGIHDPVEAPLAVTHIRSVRQPLPKSAEFDSGGEEIGDPERFSGRFSNGSRAFDVGADFYSAPDFEGGLIVFGRNVAMKIGGYVKADFIYDFDPIGETDSFVTTSIPVGAAPRTNARFHARQTRLSFDTRWTSDERTIQIFVEGDFFSDGDRFRLRHAYGEVGSLLVGQTWTTFTDVAAAPATLDFEGSVSSVNRRQAQARWTQPILHEDLTLSLAVEDTRFIIETPVEITGDPRSPSPDFVARVRLSREWGQFQIAHLYRVGGFQPTGGEVVTAPAWGFNFTGVVLLDQCSKAYYQVVFGEGIGSYRGLPDAAPTSATTGELLGLFGWMVGINHDWIDGLSSNFTYAENSLDNTVFQNPDDVHRTTYLAANLIWSPLERVNVGIEYLYGLRENVDRAVGSANRVQVAFIFDLP
ncbi:MAG: DcaP family trimeric outer membrane transporter [Planctomycetota bacterium]|jgi:hypothetical protein